MKGNWTLWIFLFVVVSLAALIMGCKSYIFTKDNEEIEILLKEERAIRTKISSQKVDDHTNELQNLFEKWNTIIEKKNDLLDKQIKGADQSLAIWIGVIAAICTILPVVLAMNQNKNFDVLIKTAKQEMEDKVKRTIDDANKKMEMLEKRQVTYNLQSFANTFAINIKILSDLEELEVNKNPFLTSKELITRELDMMIGNTDKCILEYNKIKEDLEKKNADEKEQILRCVKENAIELMLLQNNLLRRYEAFFSKESLFELHDLIDDIWYRVEAVITGKDQSQDVSKYLSMACVFCQRIQDLFKKQLS